MFHSPTMATPQYITVTRYYIANFSGNDTDTWCATSLRSGRRGTTLD